MKILFVLLMVGSTASAVTSMEGSGVRGGGDELGLEFTSVATAAMAEAAALDAGLATLVAAHDLVTVAAKMEVIAADAPLVEFSKGSFQEFVAINEPSLRRVYVNRERWAALKSAPLRRGLAFHEVLSLAGLESTGRYPHSARYLGLLGVDAGLLGGAPSSRLVFGCRDDGGAFGLRWGADRLLQLEILARRTEELTGMRELARSWGIPRWEEVEALTLQYRDEFGAPVCSFDLFDRTRFHCFLKSGATVHFYSRTGMTPVKAPAMVIWGSGTAAGKTPISFELRGMNRIPELIQDGATAPRLSSRFAPGVCR